MTSLNPRHSAAADRYRVAAGPSSGRGAAEGEDDLSSIRESDVDSPTAHAVAEGQRGSRHRSDGRDVGGFGEMPSLQPYRHVVASGFDAAISDEDDDMLDGSSGGELAYPPQRGGGGRVSPAAGDLRRGGRDEATGVDGGRGAKPRTNTTTSTAHQQQASSSGSAGTIVISGGSVNSAGTDARRRGGGAHAPTSPLGMSGGGPASPSAYSPREAAAEGSTPLRSCDSEGISPFSHGGSAASPPSAVAGAANAAAANPTSPVAAGEARRQRRMLKQTSVVGVSPPPTVRVFGGGSASSPVGAGQQHSTSPHSHSQSQSVRRSDYGEQSDSSGSGRGDIFSSPNGGFGFVVEGRGHNGSNNNNNNAGNNSNAQQLPNYSLGSPTSARGGGGGGQHSFANHNNHNHPSQPQTPQHPSAAISSSVSASYRGTSRRPTMASSANGMAAMAAAAAAAAGGGVSGNQHQQQHQQREHSVAFHSASRPMSASLGGGGGGQYGRHQSSSHRESVVAGPTYVRGPAGLGLHQHRHSTALTINTTPSVGQGSSSQHNGASGLIAPPSALLPNGHGQAGGAGSPTVSAAVRGAYHRAIGERRAAFADRYYGETFALYETGNCTTFKSSLFGGPSGHLVFGPDYVQFIGSTIATALAPCLVTGFLIRAIPIALLVIVWALWALTVLCLLRTASADPGIVRRRVHDINVPDAVTVTVELPDVKGTIRRAEPALESAAAPPTAMAGGGLQQRRPHNNGQSALFSQSDSVALGLTTPMRPTQQRQRAGSLHAAGSGSVSGSIGLPPLANGAQSVSRAEFGSYSPASRSPSAIGAAGHLQADGPLPANVSLAAYPYAGASATPSAAAPPKRLHPLLLLWPFTAFLPAPPRPQPSSTPLPQANVGGRGQRYAGGGGRRRDDDTVEVQNACTDGGACATSGSQHQSGNGNAYAVDDDGAVSASGTAATTATAGGGGGGGGALTASAAPNVTLHAYSALDGAAFDPTIPYVERDVRLRYCFICCVYRGPRTHHCRRCDNCVDLFDHHCPWTGTCIGARNYTPFLWFLLFLNLLVVAVLVSCVAAPLLLSSEDNVSIGDALLDLWYMPVVIFVIATAVGNSVLSLFLYHCFIVSIGVTTLEHIRQTWRIPQKGDPSAEGGEEDDEERADDDEAEEEMRNVGEGGNQKKKRKKKQKKNIWSKHSVSANCWSRWSGQHEVRTFTDQFRYALSLEAFRLSHPAAAHVKTPWAKGPVGVHTVGGGGIGSGGLGGGMSSGLISFSGMVGQQQQPYPTRNPYASSSSPAVGAPPPQPSSAAAAASLMAFIKADPQKAMDELSLWAARADEDEDEGSLRDASWCASEYYSSQHHHSGVVVGVGGIGVGGGGGHTPASLTGVGSVHNPPSGFGGAGVGMSREGSMGLAGFAAHGGHNGGGGGVPSLTSSSGPAASPAPHRGGHGQVASSMIPKPRRSIAASVLSRAAEDEHALYHQYQQQQSAGAFGAGADDHPHGGAAFPHPLDVDAIMYSHTAADGQPPSPNPDPNGAVAAAAQQQRYSSQSPQQPYPYYHRRGAEGGIAGSSSYPSSSAVSQHPLQSQGPNDAAAAVEGGGGSVPFMASSVVAAARGGSGEGLHSSNSNAFYQQQLMYGGGGGSSSALADMSMTPQQHQQAPVVRRSGPGRHQSINGGVTAAAVVGGDSSAFGFAGASTISRQTSVSTTIAPQHAAAGGASTSVDVGRRQEQRRAALETVARRQRSGISIAGGGVGGNSMAAAAVPSRHTSSVEVGGSAAANGPPNGPSSSSLAAKLSGFGIPTLRGLMRGDEDVVTANDNTDDEASDAEHEQTRSRTRAARAEAEAAVMGGTAMTILYGDGSGGGDRAFEGHEGGLGFGGNARANAEEDEDEVILDVSDAMGSGGGGGYASAGDPPNLPRFAPTPVAEPLQHAGGTAAAAALTIVESVRVDDNDAPTPYSHPNTGLRAHEASQSPFALGAHQQHVSGALRSSSPSYVGASGNPAALLGIGIAPTADAMPTARYVEGSSTSHQQQQQHQHHHRQRGGHGINAPSESASAFTAYPTSDSDREQRGGGGDPSSAGMFVNKNSPPSVQRGGGGFPSRGHQRGNSSSGTSDGGTEGRGHNASFNRRPQRRSPAGASYHPPGKGLAHASVASAIAGSDAPNNGGAHQHNHRHHHQDRSGGGGLSPVPEDDLYYPQELEAAASDADAVERRGEGAGVRRASAFGPSDDESAMAASMLRGVRHNAMAAAAQQSPFSSRRAQQHQQQSSGHSALSNDRKAATSLNAAPHMPSAGLLDVQRGDSGFGSRSTGAVPTNTLGNGEGHRRAIASASVDARLGGGADGRETYTPRGADLRRAAALSGSSSSSGSER